MNSLLVESYVRFSSLCLVLMVPQINVSCKLWAGHFKLHGFTEVLSICHRMCQCISFLQNKKELTSYPYIFDNIDTISTHSHHKKVLKWKKDSIYIKRVSTSQMCMSSMWLLTLHLIGYAIKELNEGAFRSLVLTFSPWGRRMVTLLFPALS